MAGPRRAVILGGKKRSGFQKKMTCPSSLHFSPVVNLVRPGETHWRCNYCEYTFKSKLYVPAKGRAHLSADAAFAKGIVQVTCPKVPQLIQQ